MDTPDEEAQDALWRRAVDWLHDELWWPRKMSPARMWGLTAMTVLALGTQTALLWGLTSGRAEQAAPLFATMVVAALLMGCLVFVSDYEDDDCDEDCDCR